MSESIDNNNLPQAIDKIGSPQNTHVGQYGVPIDFVNGSDSPSNFRRNQLIQQK